MKKILLYIYNLDYGGISESYIKLYEGLKNNYYVKLLTCINDRKYKDCVMIDETNKLSYINRLLKFIKYEDFDVIIVNPDICTIFIKIYGLIKLKNIKIITTIHLRPELLIETTNIKGKLINFIMKIGIKSSNRIVTVSKGLEKELIEKKIIKSKKIITIYNPIVKKIVKKYKYKDIENKKIIDIVIIGWISKLKGQARVLEAINKLKTHKDKTYRLNIIGGVAKEDYYKEILKFINDNDLSNNVKFWGITNKVREILNNMDIYILASDAEALPTVLIEALECGVPIIANDCKWGPREILKDGEYGIIYKRDKHEQIYEYILQLSNNNDIYNKFRENSHNRANDFQEKYSIEDYEKLIESIN